MASIFDFMSDLGANTYSSSDRTAANMGAKPVSPAEGVGVGTEDLAPSRPLKMGSDFLKPGPGLARARAAELAAAAAKPKPGYIRAASKVARFGAPTAVAGGIAQTALESPEETESRGGNIFSSLAHTGDIASLGLAPLIGRMLANKLGGQAAIDEVHPAGFDEAGRGAVATVGGAKPSPYNITRGQPSPNMSVPGGPGAPAGPSPTAPAVAAATAPVYKITNADGSVSYTNVSNDVVNAQNTNASVTQMGEQPTSKGVVTGHEGTFNVVPGVSAADRARAISASVDAKQYALARGMAKTPEDIASIDEAEKLQDQLSTAFSGKGKMTRTLAATIAGHMINAKAEGVKAKSTAQAAQIKAITDIMLQGPKVKAEAEKTGLEAETKGLGLAAAAKMVRDGKWTIGQYANYLAGHPEVNPAASVKVDTSVLPGSGESPFVNIGGTAAQPTASRLNMSAPNGSTVRGTDGKLYIVNNGQRTLAPGQ